jgi:hypothetical protein
MVPVRTWQLATPNHPAAATPSDSAPSASTPPTRPPLSFSPSDYAPSLLPLTPPPPLLSVRLRPIRIYPSDSVTATGRQSSTAGKAKQPVGCTAANLLPALLQRYQDVVNPSKVLPGWSTICGRRGRLLRRRFGKTGPPIASPFREDGATYCVAVSGRRGRLLLRRFGGWMRRN